MTNIFCSYSHELPTGITRKHEVELNRNVSGKRENTIGVVLGLGLGTLYKRKHGIMHRCHTIV